VFPESSAERGGGQDEMLLSTRKTCHGARMGCHEKQDDSCWGKKSVSARRKMEIHTE